MNTPKNVIAIDRISVLDVIGFKRISSSTVEISSQTPWIKIPIKVPAKLTVSEKIEDRVRMYTAQLVYRTCEETQYRNRIVYRCRTADGRYWLIGSDARPYPITTVNKVRPDNMTDSQLDEVTVNFTSSYKIPYII